MSRNLSIRDSQNLTIDNLQKLSTWYLNLRPHPSLEQVCRKVVPVHAHVDKGEHVQNGFVQVTGLVGGRNLGGNTARQPQFQQVQGHHPHPGMQEAHGVGPPGEQQLQVQ